MRLIASIAVASTLAGCGSVFQNDCDKEMDAARRDYGAPQEVKTYDSDDYHSHSWWWWSRGLSKTFTWSADFDCRVSDYRFSPIPR